MPAPRPTFFKTDWLDSVTSAPATSSVEDIGPTYLGLQVVTDGLTYSGFTLKAQGSIDGTNWSTFATVNGQSTPQDFDGNIGVYGAQVSVPFRYVRIRLTEFNVNSGTPTLSVHAYVQ